MWSYRQILVTAAPPKPISKRIKTAIDALVPRDVKTITAAAEKAGICREHLSREERIQATPHTVTP